MAPLVSLAVEGDLDQTVAIRVARGSGVDIGPVYAMSGKGDLDLKLRGYNQSARFRPWFVLRDLNSDEPCAPALVSRLLPEPAPHMCFRIAIHEIESWLLADREKISRFLQVSRSLIPEAPDVERHPKELLVNLARRSSGRRIREGLVPRKGATSKVGPAYNALLAGFVMDSWRPDIAARSSDSLKRCISALRELV